MTVTETVLTFVVLPAAIVLIVAALAYAGGRPHRDKRYRPGRPYQVTPVWYVASREPAAPGAAVASGPVAVTAGADRAELPAGGSGPALESSATGATGGASDRW